MSDIFALGKRSGAYDMNTDNMKPDRETPAETFQEGVTPVQAFTSPALPVLPGTPLQVRLGRPIRKQTNPTPKVEKVPDVQPSKDSL